MNDFWLLGACDIYSLPVLLDLTESLEPKISKNLNSFDFLWNSKPKFAFTTGWFIKIPANSLLLGEKSSEPSLSLSSIIIPDRSPKAKLISKFSRLSTSNSQSIFYVLTHKGNCDYVIMVFASNLQCSKVKSSEIIFQ